VNGADVEDIPEKTQGGETDKHRRPILVNAVSTDMAAQLLMKIFRPQSANFRTYSAV